ncbi:MAG: DUF302 domain-containing protein [bacterium]
MKEHKGYYISTHINSEPSKVSDILISTLNKKGLKIIKKIDITKEIKKDIGIDWIFYSQLTIMNPEITYKALSIDKRIGIFTPIRLIIYEDNDGTTIIVQDPRFSARLVDNPTIIEISQSLAELIIDILREIEGQLKNEKH